MFKQKWHTTVDVADQLDRILDRALAKNKKVSAIQVHLVNEGKGLNYVYSKGVISSEGDAEVTADHPFHAASIGKVFTATLAFMLAERGELSLDSLISERFTTEELAQLFVYQGANYADQVTVRHLMAHTSGINDYFEGKVLSGGRGFMQHLLANPDELWTPEKLIAFTRERQQAVGKPGEKFLYSDTGYILLGQIIERVSGKSFHDCLHDWVFEPLGMEHSWMMFASEPKNSRALPLQDIWLNGTEFSRLPALSCDWAGGGICTTVHDLMKFQMALRSEKILGAASLREMDSFQHRFRPGLHYGLGMMEVRFEGFFFLLRGMPLLRGHIGVTAAHMYWSPDDETYVVMNFGSTAAMVASFQALIGIVNIMGKLR